MTVKLMLSGVLAANRPGLVAIHGIYLLLSMTFQKKGLDRILESVVIIFTSVTQPNREKENAAGEKQLRQA
jgi:hypothetical protein